MNAQQKTGTVTIAASGTVSTVFNTGGQFVLIGLIMPASWDAATLSIKASMASVNRGAPVDQPSNTFPAEPAIGGGTFFDVHDTDDGNLITYTVSAGKQFQLHQQVQANHIALVSSATQSAARTITLIVRIID